MQLVCAGFKWLGTQALKLEEQGYTVLFAFEEAIGFMFGQVQHDKDGVSAAVVFAELAGQSTGSLRSGLGSRNSVEQSCPIQCITQYRPSPCPCSRGVCKRRDAGAALGGSAAAVRRF